MPKRALKIAAAALLAALVGIVLASVVKAEDRSMSCNDAAAGWYYNAPDDQFNFACTDARCKVNEYGRLGGDHALGWYGNDGALYKIIGQRSLAKRPADPAAAAVWDTYYLTGANDANGVWRSAEFRRNLYGYVGPFSVPSGTQTLTPFLTFANIPEPYHSRMAYGHSQLCGGATPGPAGTPVPATRTRVPTGPARTATRRPTLPPIAPGNCPPGAPCPVTNTPVAGCPGGGTQCQTPSAPTRTAPAAPSATPPLQNTAPAATKTTAPPTGAPPVPPTSTPSPTSPSATASPSPSPTPGSWSILPTGCSAKQ